MAKAEAVVVVVIVDVAEAEAPLVHCTWMLIFRNFLMPVST